MKTSSRNSFLHSTKYKRNMSYNCSPRPVSNGDLSLRGKRRPSLEFNHSALTSGEIKNDGETPVFPYKYQLIVFNSLSTRKTSPFYLPTIRVVTSPQALIAIVTAYHNSHANEC
jgi:hypothetical protein